MSGPAYTPAELDTMAEMYMAGVCFEAIAATLGRSRKSVCVRFVELRRERRLPLRDRPGREVRLHKTFAERAENISFVPPITLNRDDELVALTLAQGGFPRAVVTAHGTAWAGPDGMPWRFRDAHFVRPRRRMAA